MSDPESELARPTPESLRSSLLDLLGQARVVAGQDPSLEAAAAKLDLLIAALNPSEAQRLVNMWAEIIRVEDQEGVYIESGSWSIYDFRTGQEANQDDYKKYPSNRIFEVIGRSGDHLDRLLAFTPLNDTTAEVYYGIPIVTQKGGRNGAGPRFIWRLPIGRAQELAALASDNPEIIELVALKLLNENPNFLRHPRSAWSSQDAGGEIKRNYSRPLSLGIVQYPALPNTDNLLMEGLRSMSHVHLPAK